MAEEIDSPLTVTKAESAVIGGITISREVGRDVSFFQGPGESPVSSGDGRGVTSDNALSIGEDIAESGAEAEFDPTADAKSCLKLGVRLIGAPVHFEACVLFSPGF
jgi:hypothetical protein